MLTCLAAIRDNKYGFRQVSGLPLRPPAGVVVWQPVVSSPLDVQSKQVAAVGDSRAKQVLLNCCTEARLHHASCAGNIAPYDGFNAG